MTAVELEALRRLLFFSRSEAAALVAQASERAWNLWERGSRAVPADVAERLTTLAAFREGLVAETRAAIADLRRQHGEPASVGLVWYRSVEDWMTLADHEPAQWRPHCSAVAQVAAIEMGVDLVPFDGPAYRAWLGRRADGSGMRARWAAEQQPD